MKKLFLLSLAILLICPWYANAFTLVEKDDWKVQMLGFGIGYLYNDSSRSLTEIQGSTPIARPGTMDGDNGRTQFSSRGARLGFGLITPASNGWKTKGLVEMDFLGYEPTPGNVAGNTEVSFFNNPTLRLRHAYAEAQKDGWQFMVGQYWDLLGWDTDFALQTAGQPPVTGVVFQRTPQFRIMKTTALTETINLETGGSLTRSPQRDAEVPSFVLASRLTFKGRRGGFAAWTWDQKALPMMFAVSGTFRRFETGIAGGSTTIQNNYQGGAFVANAMIPIITGASEQDYSNTLSFAGEFSTGKGFADYFPGYTGNTPQLNTVNGNLANIDAGQGGYDANGIFSLIHLQSWNVQVQYFLPKGFLEDTFISAGYGNLYSNNIRNMVPRTGAVIHNESQVYFLNLYHDFTQNIRLALEFIHSETNYIDGVDGKNDRISSFIMYRFR